MKLLFVAALACLAGLAPRKPPAPVVRIEQFAFKPGELRVAVGDTVEWTNADILPHLVAADSASWKSRELAPGQHYRWVATARGRFPYHCAAHPTMHGLVIVN